MMAFVWSESYLFRVLFRPKVNGFSLFPENRNGASKYGPFSSSCVRLISLKSLVGAKKERVV
jgi:hypothetical protein